MLEPVLLPGGSILLNEPAEGARSFVAGLWFPIGSRHEAPRERGFVHFVEHMLFKGTRKRSAQDIARELDRVGGYINAYTEKDCVCVHCIVPARAWKTALDVLVDMAFDSTFAEKEFLCEREVIASEILQIDDDPDEASHDAFIARIWPGDPASLPIAGVAADILELSRDEVFSYYKKHFVAGNLIVSVSGPVPLRELEDFFSSAIPGADNSGTGKYDCPTPVFRGIRSFLPAKASQIYYYQAAQLDPPFGENDYYALSALNSIIGDAASSRLFQSLREREGMCYSVYSGFTMTRTECLWMAQAVVQPGKFLRMSTEFDRVMDSVSTGDITDSECGEAVSRLSGSFELALDDPDYRMRRCARQWIVNGFVLSADETRSRFESIEADDVRSMATRLFTSVPRARFAYGKHVSGVRRILESDGGSDGRS